MACFLVPVAEAIVTTIVEKALKSTEKKAAVKLNSADGTALEVSKTPFSAKLGWLNKLLWGGSALLAFEHVWHGEIVPFFPFLTAVKSGERRNDGRYCYRRLGRHARSLPFCGKEIAQIARGLARRNAKMTLLTTVFAAIASTIVWYKKAPENEMKVGILCWMYWGASLMWLVDAIFEYIEIGAGLFTPAPVDMLNDLFLGLSVVALGLVIWLVVLLIKDPKGVVRSALFGKK